MEQAAPFNWALLTIPLLFALAPGFLFYAGHQAARRDGYSFTVHSLRWLGAHCVTIVIVALLTVLHGHYVPGMIVTQLPLLLTGLYLAVGLLRSSAFIFSLGLATPGLWMFLQKSWEAFSGNTEAFYILPQEPFWYLLAAGVIYFLQYAKKPHELWDSVQASLITISGSYLMGGFWLLALGQPSLFATIGMPQYFWAVVLFFLAAFLLWCARFLHDAIFATCSVIGLAAGVYAFISYYPWGGA
ncbi:hypothetical protein LJC46_03045 [Desulfovibrio sp. OttesenSCG-928-G15]|nr:hypothetical protein [Desulfovibrio sp. OttesenSCG-928-G15]